MYRCLFCGTEFKELPSKYASGKFCSKECAVKYASNYNKEQKNSKIKESLQSGINCRSLYFREIYEKNPKKCIICNSIIKWDNRYRSTCSNECYRTLLSKRLGSYAKSAKLNNIVDYGNYIVYRTVNIVNNKYYIGVHKIVKEKDSYLGSGKYLNMSIKKYGRENFYRETLYSFNNSREAFEKEREVLSIKLKDPLCMNIAIGGEGGPNFLGKTHSISTRKKLREATEKRINRKGSYRMTEEQMASYRKRRLEKNGGTWFTKETIEKIKYKRNLSRGRALVG